MSKYRFLYAYWLVPAYLLFLIFQQATVYTSSQDTYENGTSYLAEVTDFDIKQIAAQSNGYVDIRFETDEGKLIERRLTLSIQMAQKLMESSNIPIRYKEGNAQEIVLFPTYDIQRSTSLFNMSVAIIGLIIAGAAGFFLNRYVKRKAANANEDKFNIERVD
ncbi:hypothetical protein [Gracilimonas mengyeensis]|uniref:Uncharacterized protein n=1 Tax=Gracilimonas mengyeensis TaxID=1302730 RepID=A0A521BBV3_9BACT|nr:hypothetical protein [Gracilimonas mengyeensis]SMO44584.1 hypothetical protein SAMN06265219_102163 [Gracilimonas mengyeensis]